MFCLYSANRLYDETTLLFKVDFENYLQLFSTETKFKDIFVSYEASMLFFGDLENDITNN